MSGLLILFDTNIGELLSALHLFGPPEGNGGNLVGGENGIPIQSDLALGRLPCRIFPMRSCTILYSGGQTHLFRTADSNTLRVVQIIGTALSVSIHKSINEVQMAPPCLSAPASLSRLSAPCQKLIFCLAAPASLSRLSAPCQKPIISWARQRPLPRKFQQGHHFRPSPVCPGRVLANSDRPYEPRPNLTAASLVCWWWPGASWSWSFCLFWSDWKSIVCEDGRRPPLLALNRGPARA